MLASPRAFTAHLVGACTVLASLMGASAAITWSGSQEIPIPTNFAGIYLNFDDAADASSFTTPPESAVVGDPLGDPPVAGVDWDVNFFFSGVAVAYSPDFQPFIDDDPDPTNQSQVLNVAPGTTIDSTSASGQVLGIAGYGGSGKPAGSPSGESHFDIPDTNALNPEYGAFTVGTPGYLAFVANVEGTTVYGWMQVTLENTDEFTTGTIHDWAWSDTAIDVGQIPEPGAALLSFLGVLALLRRRRA